MDSTDELAIGDPFQIGPSSLAGKFIVVRILLCKSATELLSVLCFSASKHIQYAKTLLAVAVRSLLSCLNPRKYPSMLLTAAVVRAAFLLRRARSVKVNAGICYRRKFWKNMMDSANTYEEWVHAARMHEKDCPRRKDSDLYDEELVKAKLAKLRQTRLQGNVEDMLFCLWADLVRNLGNMCNPQLYKGRYQTPKLIQGYIDEVGYHLHAVCEMKSSDEFSLDEKITLIHQTRHVFGRTALLLSGGGTLGAFHLGVVRTLIEHRLFPRIIAGASVGSVISAFAATRTWPELQKFFEDPNPPLHFFESMGNIFAIAHRLLTYGAVHDIGQLQRMMRQLIGDLTFQEAYDLSGRVLGIPVCSPRKHDPPRCLNYLTSPNVVIWSAVTASCAFPGLFEAQELMAKDRQGNLIPYHSLAHVGQEEVGIARRQWRDGSLESDLPMMHLKELFNVNQFIVSQANPHIAPLLRLKEAVRTYGGEFAGKVAHLVELEVKHHCRQVLELGFPLGGVSKLFSQDWEGDITIVMPATLAQFTKMIQNPGPIELRKAVMQGRRCTWAKLSAIKANCGIELMLDECVLVLNQQHRIQRASDQKSQMEPSNKSRPRLQVPSCVHIESWENSPVASILDDGSLEVPLIPAGGPWGGRSIPITISTQMKKSGDTRDTENNIDNLNDQSWTKAGGPFMRSPSANKLVVLLGFENDVTVADNVKEALQDSSIKEAAN